MSCFSRLTNVDRLAHMGEPIKNKYTNYQFLPYKIVKIDEQPLSYKRYICTETNYPYEW